VQILLARSKREEANQKAVKAHLCNGNDDAIFLLKKKKQNPPTKKSARARDVNE
jgi:hypothetical protein